MLKFKLRTSLIKLFFLESQEAKCPNKCDEKLALLKNEMDKNRKALNEKRKYVVDGVFMNEQVN